MNLDVYCPAVAVAFGDRLREARERAGLTQEELAKRMGLKRQANISAWERRLTPPKPPTVVRLAKEIRCTPACLLDDVETDYDRLKRGEPLAVRVKTMRKIAVGESPPTRPLPTVKGKRRHPR